jgi:hypothetical protein
LTSLPIQEIGYSFSGFIQTNKQTKRTKTKREKNSPLSVFSTKDKSKQKNFAHKHGGWKNWRIENTGESGTKPVN